MGLACGPLVASILSTKYTSFTIYLPTIHTYSNTSDNNNTNSYNSIVLIIFNNVTAPGWIMAISFFICLIFIIFYFEDPKENQKSIYQSPFTPRASSVFASTYASFNTSSPRPERGEGSRLGSLRWLGRCCSPLLPIYYYIYSFSQFIYYYYCCCFFGCCAQFGFTNHTHHRQYTGHNYDRHLYHPINDDEEQGTLSPQYEVIVAVDNFTNMSPPTPATPATPAGTLGTATCNRVPSVDPSLLTFDPSPDMVIYHIDEALLSNNKALLPPPVNKHTNSYNAYNNNNTTTTNANNNTSTYQRTYLAPVIESDAVSGTGQSYPSVSPPSLPLLTLQPSSTLAAVAQPDSVKPTSPNNDSNSNIFTTYDTPATISSRPPTATTKTNTNTRSTTTKHSILKKSKESPFSLTDPSLTGTSSTHLTSLQRQNKWTNDHAKPVFDSSIGIYRSPRTARSEPVYSSPTMGTLTQDNLSTHTQSDKAYNRGNNMYMSTHDDIDIHTPHALIQSSHIYDNNNIAHDDIDIHTPRSTYSTNTYNSTNNTNTHTNNTHTNTHDSNSGRGFETHIEHNKVFTKSLLPLSIQNKLITESNTALNNNINSNNNSNSNKSIDHTLLYDHTDSTKLVHFISPTNAKNNNGHNSDRNSSNNIGTSFSDKGGGHNSDHLLKGLDVIEEDVVFDIDDNDDDAIDAPTYIPNTYSYNNIVANDSYTSLNNKDNNTTTNNNDINTIITHTAIGNTSPLKKGKASKLKDYDDLPLFLNKPTKSNTITTPLIPSKTNANAQKNDQQNDQKLQNKIQEFNHFFPQTLRNQKDPLDNAIERVNTLQIAIHQVTMLSSIYHFAQEQQRLLSKPKMIRAYNDGVDSGSEISEEEVYETRSTQPQMTYNNNTNTNNTVMTNNNSYNNTTNNNSYNNTNNNSYNNTTNNTNSKATTIPARGGSNPSSTGVSIATTAQSPPTLLSSLKVPGSLSFQPSPPAYGALSPAGIMGGGRYSGISMTTSGGRESTIGEGDDSCCWDHVSVEVCACRHICLCILLYKHISF